MTTQRYVSLLSLLLGGGWFALAQEPKKPATSDLVAVQEGKLPIILSAPHGGTKPIPDVPARTGEGMTKGGAGYFTGRDVGTEELAHAVAEAIEAKLKAKPYFVIARFHRKYLDANRPTAIGMESEKARPTYDAYHDHLAKFCRDVQKKYGRGLLLDIHGQGSAADTVFRGTANGKSVKLLVERFGKDAHEGPKSLFGFLAAGGWKVYPTEAGAPEKPGLNGGYITRHYGSSDTYGIDAYQLEFGGDYRKKEHRAETARKLAEAVARYAELYLPAKPVN